MILENIKIICGGQSGVDRAALDFALKNGIQCGGWCPRGRLAEDGIIPFTYPLKESTTSSYEERTMLNIRDADGTIIIYMNEMDKGSKLTHELAYSMKRPLITIKIQDDQYSTKEQFRNWMTKNHISVLNFAGPRESSSPGIYQDTINFLDNLLVNN